jgi:hypothetical protein
MIAGTLHFVVPQVAIAPDSQLSFDSPIVPLKESAWSACQVELENCPITADAALRRRAIEIAIIACVSAAFGQAPRRPNE